MLRDIKPWLRVIKAAVAKYPETMWAESEFLRLDGVQMLKILMSEPPKVPDAKRADGPRMKREGRVPSRFRLRKLLFCFLSFVIGHQITDCVFLSRPFRFISAVVLHWRNTTAAAAS